MQVFVYWNLHKHCFSVKSLETGRVVAHAKLVHLENVNWIVGKAGQARVRREGRKNVHAGARGYLKHAWLVDNNELTTEGPEKYHPTCCKVRYNPYENDTFVNRRGTPVKKSSSAILQIAEQKDGSRKAACFAAWYDGEDPTADAADTPIYGW